MPRTNPARSITSSSVASPTGHATFHVSPFSCDSCSSRKYRCDYGKPSCTSCMTRSLKCVYTEKPRCRATFKSHAIQALYRNYKGGEYGVLEPHGPEGTSYRTLSHHDEDLEQATSPPRVVEMSEEQNAYRNQEGPHYENLNSDFPVCPEASQPTENTMSFDIDTTALSPNSVFQSGYEPQQHLPYMAEDYMLDGCIDPALNSYGTKSMNAELGMPTTEFSADWSYTQMEGPEAVTSSNVGYHNYPASDLSPRGQ